VLEGYAAANATTGNGIFASSVRSARGFIFLRSLASQTHLNGQLSPGQ
jgi:hypothetical protein